MNNQVFYLVTQGFMFLVILYIQVKGPKFTSSNIILGVKIPQDKVKNEELNSIYNKYKREVILVGISLTFIFTIIMFYKKLSNAIFLFQVLYVAGLYLVYWRYNKKIKEVKKRENWKNLVENTRVMETNYTKEKQKIKSIFTWSIIPNLMVLANIAILVYMYNKLPSDIYGAWNYDNILGEYVYKSKMSIFTVVFTQIIIIVIAYLAYYSISRARMYIDPDNIENSIASNQEYVNKWSNMLIGNLIVVQLILSYINMANLGFTTINSLIINLFSIITFIVIAINIYTLNKFSKEVAIMRIIENPSSKYYIEDDKYWKAANSFYYNKQDPAIFVKSRFGPGHTVNIGTILGKIIAILGITVIIAAAIIIVYDVI
nr:hypothetical protein [Tissierella sp.]